MFVIEVSQVATFKPILSFLSLHVNTTMHDYTINNYCYRHNYFNACALQVIT